MAAVSVQDGGPIYSREAFKENSQAKLEWCFAVVDNSEPDKGVQLAIEANLLGDKVKAVIAHAIKLLDDGTGRGVGERLGNPLVTPYAIRWEFNPAKDIEFGKMYDAIRMEKIRMTPAIEKLIRDTDPPDTSTLRERFNLKTHRALLERHALVKLPWDQFFEAAFALEAKGKLDEPPAQEEPAAEPDYVPEVAAAPPAPAQDEEFACDTDGCEAVLKATDPKCPQCGRAYEVIAATPPPPPKPALPKRSTATAPATQTAALPPASPPPQDLGDQGNDVPFASCTLLTFEATGCIVACEQWNATVPTKTCWRCGHLKTSKGLALPEGAASWGRDGQTKEGGRAPGRPREHRRPRQRAPEARDVGGVREHRGARVGVPARARDPQAGAGGPDDLPGRGPQGAGWGVAD